MSEMDHTSYVRLALSEAKKSPPKPSNFCVGAVLVSRSASEPVLSTGYTLELEGNTHAEQCALLKFAQAHNISEHDVGQLMPSDTILYTTMEPCNLRVSGNIPCVDRILQTRTHQGSGIQKVYIGVKEPKKFMVENQGRAKLEAAGVEVIHITGLEEEILSVATAGHEK